jgi:hypothetical protein
VHGRPICSFNASELRPDVQGQTHHNWIRKPSIFLIPTRCLIFPEAPARYRSTYQNGPELFRLKIRNQHPMELLYIGSHQTRAEKTSNAPGIT